MSGCTKEGRTDTLLGFAVNLPAKRAHMRRRAFHPLRKPCLPTGKFLGGMWAGELCPSLSSELKCDSNGQLWILPVLKLEPRGGESLSLAAFCRETLLTLLEQIPGKIHVVMKPILKFNKNPDFERSSHGSSILLEKSDPFPPWPHHPGVGWTLPVMSQGWSFQMFAFLYLAQFKALARFHLG